MLQIGKYNNKTKERKKDKFFFLPKLSRLECESC